MSYEFFVVETADHVSTITLNRSDKLNALSHAMTREFHVVLDGIEAQFPDVRAIIITGTGRGFCSGADVGEQRASLDGGGEQPPPGRIHAPRTVSITALAPRLRSLPQATIAAVNGVAAGAGLALALACDIRIASESSRFSSIFIKRSLMPDTAASYTLPQLVGFGVAAEMTLTGRMYGAAWAKEKGLVNEVVPEDGLMEEAMSLASEIASNPPLAVRAAKELMYKLDMDLRDVIEREMNANLPLRHTEDRLEAATSFLEKRPPVYKGR